MVAWIKSNSWVFNIISPILVAIFMFFMSIAERDIRDKFSNIDTQIVEINRNVNQLHILFFNHLNK